MTVSEWQSANGSRRAMVGGVSRLVVIQHTPSPVTRGLLEDVLAGAQEAQSAADGEKTLEVMHLPALAAGVRDVLGADGYLLGTPANFGYMSGALKHFFDQVYYPCLDATAGRPYGLWVHGNDDTTGAVRSVESIVSGLGWRAVSRPISVIGPADATARHACHELGATVAAHVLGLI